KYVGLVNMKKQELESKSYRMEAFSMQKKVSEMIHSKQKATVAMAIALSGDRALAKNIKDKKVSHQYYRDLSRAFRENTLYKNIWIQIIDKDLNSIYRSWTDRRGDSLKSIRNDVENVIKTKKINYFINICKYDLSIKAIVPILDKEEVVGALEVISHFNSISKQMNKFGVDSIVVLDKKYKSKVLYPYTNIFVDDYYVANFDAPLYLQKHLKGKNIKQYMDKDYIIHNDSLLTSYNLKSIDGEIIGYFIMSKNIKSILKTDLEYFVFKWIALGLIGIMIVAGITNIILFYLMRKQKVYYKNIIDSSKNIMMVNDGKQIIDASKMFFTYFNKYNSIEEFKLEHECICDFFVEEDEYLGQSIDGLYWINYIIKNNNQTNKVKLKYENNVYYFSLNAVLISKEDNYYSVVLSDITNEETYRHELEEITITDSLTGIGNRRHFHNKINDEIYNCIRYKHPLSLIMLDIDYFKHINDEYGHIIGDEVLMEYTKFISSHLRESDVFCRIGGEEFIILLPYTKKKDAEKIAEKLRVNVEEYKKVVPITISFGVSQYIENEDVNSILKRVDDALYEAKNSGRNRVSVK
ncbi:MAG: diguanylate cyclase, partial [Thiovulaceae bacterium]|nr:diguanylate cyclase [Sulfurimonadaceae bacterium]